MRLFLLLIIGFFPFVLSAQNFASIRGLVTDKETGEPVIAATLYLKEAKTAVQTDLNGFYTLTKIKAGTYTLQCSYVGYDTLRETISLVAGQIINKRFELTQRGISLRGVEISADKQEARTTVKVSVETVTAKQITQLASVGGEADIAQYLQILPGVVFTGDQGGQLYIRGGSPIQNKVLLDGMVVYNPFHSIGLFSVFETDLIKNAEVYTGGFNAQHGGRISAVMDVSTKDGNPKRIRGKASASPFTGRFLIEGPIGKAKGNSLPPTFIVAAKNSFLEQTSKTLYKYINNGTGLPYNFTDIYAKTTFGSKSGSKLNLFGFNFRDRVNFTNVTNVNWNTYGGGTDFIIVPGGSATLIKGNFAYSNYQIQQIEADGKPRTSGIGSFNGGLNFSYFLGQNQIDYGFEALGFATNFQFYNSLGRKIGQDQNTTELSGFVKYRHVTPKIVVEPGLHLHYYASLGETTVEPRLGAKWNVTDNFRLKMAAGLYSQNLLSAVSDRDVVNLFYGFLSGPDDLPAAFNGKPLTTKLQKARHIIVGTELDITNNLELNVEAYLKDFTQLVNINRNKLFDDVPTNAAIPDIQKKTYIVEIGQAKGIDFRLKYQKKNIYLWGTYSYAFVDRFDGITAYYPHFDRRHNVNLLGTYTLGKDLDWEMSVRWNYGSGFPFTKTQGFYEQFQFSNGINTNYTTQNGELGILYGELNAGRLPSYHRLDYTLKKSFTLGDFTSLDATFSITNLYNRQNIFYFDRVRFQRVNQLPFLPSVSLMFNF